MTAYLFVTYNINHIHSTVCCNGNLELHNDNDKSHVFKPLHMHASTHTTECLVKINGNLKYEYRNSIYHGLSDSREGHFLLEERQMYFDMELLKRSSNRGLL
jgi:hypothetical protein